MKVGLKSLGVLSLVASLVGCGGSSSSPPRDAGTPDVTQTPDTGAGGTGGAGGRAGSGGAGGTGGMGGTGGATMPDAGRDTAPPPDTMMARPAAFSIMPTSAAFGMVMLNTDSAPTTFTVTNTGGTAAAVTATLGGADMAHFQMPANTCNQMLPPAATCMVTVRFRPTTAGNKTANLTVSGGGAMVMAALTGTGVAPSMLTVTPTMHDFGMVEAGKTGTATTFTVRNTGMGPSGMLAVTSSNVAFRIDMNGCAMLAAGAMCMVTVNFAPTTVGAQMGTLSIMAPNGGMAAVSLSGTGVPAVTLAFDAAMKDAGDSPIGVRKDVTFTLTNSGMAPSGVPTITVGGTNAQEFPIVANGCMQALAPMASCTVTLGFTPASAGMKTATITAAATPGGMVSATVTGTGTAMAQLALSPSSRDFGLVVDGSGQFNELDFTVQNTGTGSSTAITAVITAGTADFSVVQAPSGDCQGTMLAPGVSCTVRVRFRPLAVGEKAGTLQVSATSGGQATAALTGRMIPQSQLAAGLRYRAFEGSWTVLPDFDTLSPARVGTISNFDIGVRSRDDFFGVEFSGFIRVDVAGAYTFFTNSDEGSKLFIGGQQVVNNDGLHGPQEVQGTVTLAAGYHQIKVVYFDREGGQTLTVSWQGPGLVKQPIPDGVLYRALEPMLPSFNPGSVVAGVNYKYYEGTWTMLPDFSQLTPVKSGPITGFELWPRNVNDNFGFEFSGYIDVPMDGEYTFYTVSDDGSRLYIDNRLVVDNDGVHTSQERAGTVRLQAGYHTIRVTYFEATGPQEILGVYWQGPGIGKQLIPGAVLFRSEGVTMLPATNPGAVVSGLDYKYYEGTWTVLPDFTQLTAVKTGTVSTFDLSPRNRNENIAFEFTGFINIATAAEYTFFTNSKDGSKLYLDGVQVVDNDGLHALQERQGVVHLAAGYHAIRVTWFAGPSAGGLDVYYQSAGIAKQAIPAHILFRPANLNTLPAVNPGAVVQGLHYKAFEGAWGTLPSFDQTTPVAVGNASVFGVAQRSRDDDFGLDFTGYIFVPSTGEYTFFTTSKDGSRLWIDGQLVVDNDGVHAAQERMGMVSLAAGYHAIRVGFFNGTGAELLEVSYQGPGLPKQTIPGSVLYRTTTMPAVYAGTVVQGLAYRYYQGNWTMLPNFAALTPNKTGNVANFDLSVRDRDNNFGLQFTGYVQVPTEGDYTFFTNSDDGSRLYIGGQLVVDNDGVHAAQERMGTVRLAPGYHLLRVDYFNTTGARLLEVSWQGPGIGKQAMPNAVLYRN